MSIIITGNTITCLGARVEDVARTVYSACPEKTPVNAHALRAIEKLKEQLAAEIATNFDLRERIRELENASD